MAIQRPDRGAAGPRNKNSDEATPVAEIVKSKKKTLDVAKNKSTAAAAPKVNKTVKSVDKSKTKVKKKAPAKPKKKAAPKLPRNESEWIKYIEGMKLSELLTFIDSKAGKLNVTAQAVIKRKIDDMTKLITDLPSDYNGWLEYFSSMTPDETDLFLVNHVLTLDNEAVAAGKRWAQIYENPALIDRMVTSKLKQEQREEIGNILTAAKSGDRIKTFEALRDNLAYKLEDGSGARDMTVLIKQLNEVMVTLDELYREAGVKDDAGSSIRKLLVRSRKMAARPKARQAATTIAEAEADDDDEDLA